MNVSIDGALELADAWDAAAERADEELKPVVSKGSLNIKNDWRRRWSGISSHAPRTYQYINYDDPTVEGESIVSEIGPDKDRKDQAPLGAILEFGALAAGTSPHPGGQPALDAEAPKFERAAGDAAEKLADV